MSSSNPYTVVLFEMPILKVKLKLLFVSSTRWGSPANIVKHSNLNYCTMPVWMKVCMISRSYSILQIFLVSELFTFLSLFPY